MLVQLGEVTVQPCVNALTTALNSRRRDQFWHFELMTHMLTTDTTSSLSISDRVLG